MPEQIVARTVKGFLALSARWAGRFPSQPATSEPIVKRVKSS